MPLVCSLGWASSGSKEVPVHLTGNPGGIVLGSNDRARVSSASDYNYLLLSDVHLGAGIVSHARPWASGWRAQCTAVDEALVACLDQYDGDRPHGKPWRLVIAGDFIDFIGMSLTPPEGELPSGVTDEEHAHGLGNSADHAIEKLRAAADWHHAAFTALARFVASCNELILVRGNHDVDFHWEAVQQAFIDLLHEHGPTHIRRMFYRARTTFCPWFYRVGDLLYVEHGHEFDPMCSYGDPLSPLCPRDQRRIRWSPSDVMLRYVARPTPGLSTTSYEQGTVAAYLKLVASLGVVGGVRLIGRFVRAAARLVMDSLRHQRSNEEAQQQRFERMCRYAQRFRVAREVVHAMNRAYATPVSMMPKAIVSRLYLDRMVLLSLAVISSLAAVGVAAGAPAAAGVLGGIAAGLAVLSGRTGSRGEDPVDALRRGAEKISGLFPARYVVMGHTHHPTFDSMPGGSHYVNLGHWGQDDLPEDRPNGCMPPCSHLVITCDGGGRVTAELRRWDLRFGHRPYVFPTVQPAPEPGRCPVPVPDELSAV